MILLALTSNAGALDFQFSTDTKGEKLFEKVLRKSSEWGNEERLMYVVGATRSEAIADVRAKVPNHFFLVPGVGAQGGTVAEVAKYGWNKDCGLLINSSRGIIYADDSENFGEAAGLKAKELQGQMAEILSEKGF